MFSLFKFDARRTFRPLRGHQGPGALRLHALSLAQLEAGDMEAAAALPPGVALNDWLAAHVVDFHNAAALIFGIACDGCSAASCPSMNAGPRFEFLWSASGGGAPARLPARDYVDRLFSWIGALLDDPAVFPASSSTAAPAAYPRDFLETVRAITRRLFRVYAHVYYHHFGAMTEAGAEAHINTCLSHLVVFSAAHALIDAKELAPLQELIDRLAAARAATAAAAVASGAGVGVSAPH